MVSVSRPYNTTIRVPAARLQLTPNDNAASIKALNDHEFQLMTSQEINDFNSQYLVHSLLILVFQFHAQWLQWAASGCVCRHCHASVRGASSDSPPYHGAPKATRARNGFCATIVDLITAPAAYASKARRPGEVILPVLEPALLFSTRYGRRWVGFYHGKRRELEAKPSYSHRRKLSGESYQT